MRSRLQRFARTDPPSPARQAKWKLEESDALHPFNGVEGFLVRTALVRAESHKETRDIEVLSSAAVIYICGHLRTAAEEHVVTLCLDTNNHLMAIHESAIGGKMNAAITASDVLRVVLLVGASSFILVHNHPSGNPKPSEQDQILTEKMAQAGKCVGITLLDHIVIAGNRYTSMLEEGHS